MANNEPERLVLGMESFSRLSNLISRYLANIYEYNNNIKKHGYYLKPVHIVVKRNDDKVVKYYYYGRYWYRIEKIKGSKSKLKWIYIGKIKPARDLPDPPANPLEGLIVKVTDREIEVTGSRSILYLISKSLEND